jgi:hypothetical protein
MQETPVTVVTPPQRPSSLVGRFSAERGRRSMVEEARAMYEEDARIDGSIATMARDAVHTGFDLNITGPRAEEAQEIADDLFKRIDFFGRVDDWTRLTARDGDTFLELGANASGQIVEITRKPSLEMRRNSDEFDRFPDPLRAFYWTDKADTGEAGPGTVYFAEWQIVHARYKRDEGSRYGRPLFSSARTAYKRVKEGELDIAIRRKTRAGMKYVHSLEDASEGDVEAYKSRNRDALGDPFAAVADFFSNKKTSIQTIQGDARLSEIDDVLHHIDTMSVASPVPLELIGYGRNLNRDVLEQKKEQYEEGIPAVRGWIVAELVRPLLERQWLLSGIWPDSLTWSVEWRGKKTPSPEGFLKIAQALTALKATGLFEDETLLRLFGVQYPGFDVTAALEALAQRQPDDMPDRIGSEAQ